MAQEDSKERWILFSLSTCMFLSSVGTSIPNVALPTLANTFSATFSEIQWVIVLYLLANTISIVTVGRAGDVFGREKVLRIGILLFSFSAILCGISNSLWILISARIVQGLGSAILMALSVALIGELIPKSKMGKAMGLLGTSSAVGTASGSSIGGLILATFGWKSIFYFMGLLGIIGFAITFYALPRSPSNQGFVRKPFDYMGTFLISLTLMLFSLAISGGFSPVLMFFCLVSGISFYSYERKVESPLVQFETFKDVNLASNLIMNICVSTVMMSTLIAGPFYLSRSLGLGVAMVGAVMTVGPLMSIISGIPAGRIVDRIGPSNVILFGLSQILMGTICFSFLPSRFGLTGYIVSAAILSPGYQMFQAGNNSMVMMDIPANQRGVVSGVLSLSRNIGLITGASAMGAIFMANGMQMTFLTATALAFFALILSLKLKLSKRRAG